MTFVKSSGSRSNIFYRMSSLHFEKFLGISFNLELYQKHNSPPMLMTLFLETLGALTATKAHVAPRLLILNVLPMYIHIFQGSNFPKQYYALNMIFKSFRYKNFKTFSDIQLYQWQPLTGILTKSCSEVFHKFHRKTPALESLFNKDEGFIWPANLLSKDT